MQYLGNTPIVKFAGSAGELRQRSSGILARLGGIDMGTSELPPEDREQMLVALNNFQGEPKKNVIF